MGGQAFCGGNVSPPVIDTNLHVVGGASKHHLARSSLFLLGWHCFVGLREGVLRFQIWTTEDVRERTQKMLSIILRRTPRRVFSTRRTSEEVHGVLTDAEITSKAMRRRLAAQQGPPTLPTIPTNYSAPNNVSPYSSPPPAYSQPQPPSFFQYMMLGGAVTLGFIVIGTLFKAIGLEKEEEGSKEVDLYQPPLK